MVGGPFRLRVTAVEPAARSRVFDQVMQGEWVRGSRRRTRHASCQPVLGRPPVESRPFGPLAAKPQPGRARGHIRRARRAERRGGGTVSGASGGTGPPQDLHASEPGGWQGGGVRPPNTRQRDQGSCGARGAPRAVRRGESLLLHQPATCQRVRAGPGAGDCRVRVREGGPPSASSAMAVSPTERRPTTPESESASFCHPPGGSCALHTLPRSFKLCSCCAQHSTPAKVFIWVASLLVDPTRAATARPGRSAGTQAETPWLSLGRAGGSGLVIRPWSRHGHGCKPCGVPQRSGAPVRRPASARRI